MLIQQAVGMRPSEMRACRGLCKREALRLSIRLGKKNGVLGNMACPGKPDTTVWAESAEFALPEGI
jgi:hypothetical protein